MIRGYLREDGRKGIRNAVAVVYLVECAHHVARQIVEQSEGEVQCIGFPGCFPNRYAQNMMEKLCTHPNVGAVLVVSLGCESFDRQRLHAVVESSGRPVSTMVIQQVGGTLDTIAQGRQWVQEAQIQLRDTPRVDMAVSDLVIGTVCGGSDGTSGITGNPAVGLAFDALVDQGARCIFEETGELIGCESHLASRAVNPILAKALDESVKKAARYYATLGYGSFAPGNADGGLTTIEEKSLGAYAKSGSRPITGLLKPGDFPVESGLYLLDVVPDGEVRFGFPNISDNAEIVEMIACGAHMTLFVTGRGSVVGSAISPVIKIAANPQMYERLSGDMDINAGSILSGQTTLVEVGQQIVETIIAVAEGAETKSEALGHREFILTYKYFESNESQGTNC
ncbi:MAG: UxaA family hydrolase [Gammaproteobacteria bacterium]|nr:UxaA family hydrolase [Gammaproteobacteria bacterium]